MLRNAGKCGLSRCGFKAASLHKFACYILHVVGLVHGSKVGSVNIHMAWWKAVTGCCLEEIREEISAALPKTEAMS